MKRKVAKRNPKSFNSNKFLEGIKSAIGLPSNPKQAYEIGLLIGEKEFYDLVLNNSITNRNINQYSDKVEDILQKVDLGNNFIIQNLPNNPLDAFEFGRFSGIKKAIQFIILVNFNKSIIKDEQYNLNNIINKKFLHTR